MPDRLEQTSDRGGTAQIATSGAKNTKRDFGATSIFWVLGHSIVLVALIPFLPLAYLTWSGYREDVARVEAEIQATNRQIARLSVNYLDDFLRRVWQETLLVKADAEPSARLPKESAFIRWERVGRDGLVVASQASAARVGKNCGYEPFLGALRSQSGPKLSTVDWWIEGMPPTVLLGLATGGRAGDQAGKDHFGTDPTTFIVGILKPEGLHDALAARSDPTLDRHVYVVDETGRLIFYSDIMISRRGHDLTQNPPIRMHLQGRQGAIRFNSVVSGKTRLGFVQRLAMANWAVIVSADIGSRLIGLRSRYIALVWSIIFALLAAVAIMLWASRRLARPLLYIRDALRNKGRSEHGPLLLPSQARRIAEYDELVRSFDSLSERYAITERELIQAEKVSLLGQMASGVAHEIGTPLNVISGNAQYILRKLGQDDPARSALEMIVKQAARITAIIRRLLDFSRPTEARLVPVDLGVVVAQTLEMAAGITSKLAVRVDCDPDTPKVMGDPKLLEHVLLNLIVNACQAMPEGGSLSITVGVEVSPRPGDEDGDSWVYCRVIDSGCGISLENQGKIFQPYFTTKAPGAGNGLGLAIAERIVKQHGGRIEFSSRPEHGTVFTIRLRAADSTTASNSENDSA